MNPPRQATRTTTQTESHHQLTQKLDMDHHCRSCGSRSFELIDLGDQPLANQLLTEIEAEAATFPLAVNICSSCSLAQLSYCVDKRILYTDYNYITPESAELTGHYGKIHEFLSAEGYLTENSRVLDIGSNVGRLLSYLKPRVQSVLGIDPAANIVDLAIDYEIPTLCRFFNQTSAREVAEFSGRKDVVFIRHCFAHNDDPGKILTGIPHILAPDGTLVIENAYFGDTVAKGEFDQIYHEHMYYYTLRGISVLLRNRNFSLVDAYHSDIHGGTMVFVAQPKETARPPSQRVRDFLEAEAQMHTPEFYEDFISQIRQNRSDLRQLVQKLRSKGKMIHAYGASAKATTLLNYYNLANEDIPAIVDSTPTKHGKYVPGIKTRIISEVDAAAGDPPDFYLLTIWNYRDEIIRKVRESGNHHTQFILPHPAVEIV